MVTGIGGLAFGHPSMLFVLAIAFNLIICGEKFHSRAMSTPLAAAGRIIDILERRYNRPQMSAAMRKADGISVVAFLCFVSLLFGLVADAATIKVHFAWIATAILAGTLLNVRTFLDRSLAFTLGLERSLSEGRATLALLSGRDTTEMDHAGATRAGVECTSRFLAEGIVASAFYFFLFGLAGLFLFKAINIASQLLDERSDWTRDFGWAAARINEALVWPVSWVTAVLIALAAAPLSLRSTGAAIGHALKERGKLKGWASGCAAAAMAGAVGIKLEQPLIAKDGDKEAHSVGPEELAAHIDHLGKARQIYVTVCFLLVVLALLLTSARAPLPLTYWPFL